MKSTIENQIMKNPKIKLLSVFFILIQFGLSAYAQNQKRPSIKVQSKLVNDKEQPISNALIVLGDGLVQTHTDAQGNFSLEADAENMVHISANGYKDKVILLSSETVKDKVVMQTTPLFEGKQHTIELPAYGKTTQRALTGAISKISGTALESQPDIVFSNALQGRLAGLSARMTTNGLGNNVPNLFVRGLSREDVNGAITIVDGVERSIEFLNAEEILSVEVLKDATAKILYGSRATNGVVLITTKRGIKNTQVIKGSVEYGANITSRKAKYLNSADYATLYNEALANDGFPAKYSAQDILGYRNSTGVNDLLYPNIDHNSYFLNDTNPFRKAFFEYSGGTDASQYGIFLGYIGTDGMEKIGDTPKQDRINVRGNLDFDATKNLKAHISINGIIESRNWGKLGQDGVFGKINSERPNEFPLVITDPNFQGEGASLGDEVIPPLGGSFENPTSLYGDLMYGGYQENVFFYGQTNFGLDYNLNQLVKGLSIATNLSFDNYQSHTADQISNPIRYAVQKGFDVNGDPVVSYTQLNKRIIERNRTERASNITRALGWTSNLKYSTLINKDHKLDFDLSYFYYLNQDTGRFQNIDNSNTYLKTNYSVKNKYYLESTIALMGSNKFAKENRHFLASSLGLAWVLSEENFLKDSKWVNFLKLKSSYGVLGYDSATDFYLYDTRYYRNGTFNLGERNITPAVPRTGLNNFGNPNLLWERAKDFNVGVEGSLFKNTLQFEVNYFNENRDRIIFNNPAFYTSVNGGLNTPQNVGAVENNGVDGSVNWLGTIGDLKLNIGANFLYTKNKVKATNQAQFPDTYLNAVGNSSDAIFGFVSNGLFKTQQEVDNAPFQALGEYGVGNVSFKDLNNDGVINEQDKTVIGNSFPRTTLGFNLDAKYKGFGLSVLMTSEMGVDIIKNNAYFRNSGEGKYSVLATDRFHPINNPNGSQPILTTLDSSNDNQVSTFWMENASFLRLKNTEFSYSFSNDLWTVKTVKFFVRGTNLFVLSNVKGLDPEVPNSGVNNYPLFRTITGGVTLGF
ncbi:SusC/RagA family TonB-linked outer membrane protein [Flavobacterium sp. UMI-01]|uniref:SusC/RagA family TonB-linked outer membrane protein n=1 Tax=Flavobacterium sp. UMI-01 TaxID=1441053 RepID=UPI001C7D4ED3|nr:SusC/RagA family TonB-linked outer membrane protein [Flavobacterium sp. UMI-01]